MEKEVESATYNYLNYYKWNISAHDEESFKCTLNFDVNYIYSDTRK